MKIFRKTIENTFLIISLTLITTASAQENYIEGYIINMNNDTIFGYINYQNWEKDPNKVQFKTAPDKEPVSYKPMEIKEFKTGDEIYVSAVVKAEISSTDTRNLTYNPEAIIVTDTTFLQSLFRGDKNLFYSKKKQ